MNKNWDENSGKVLKLLYLRRLLKDLKQPLNFLITTKNIVKGFKKIVKPSSHAYTDALIPHIRIFCIKLMWEDFLTWNKRKINSLSFILQVCIDFLQTSLFWIFPVYRLKVWNLLRLGKLTWSNLLCKHSKRPHPV